MLITINNKLIDFVSGVKFELNDNRVVTLIDTPKYDKYLDLYRMQVYNAETNSNFFIVKDDIKKVIEEVVNVNDTYSIKTNKISEQESVIIKAKKEHEVDGVIKPKYSLMPQKALLEVAKVFTYGEHKYDAYNYSKGEYVTTYIDEAMRHINDFLCNEDIDKETKTNHLVNAAADILMTLDNILNGTSIYNRNKNYKTNDKEK
jgi:hypothetical protein